MFQQHSAFALSGESENGRLTGRTAIDPALTYKISTYVVGDELVALQSDTVFVIFVRRDGAQLVEISPDDFVADTWHATIADAKRDAGLEETVWRLVPTEEEDAVDFARSLAPKKATH